MTILQATISTCNKIHVGLNAAKWYLAQESDTTMLP